MKRLFLRATPLLATLALAATAAPSVVSCSDDPSTGQLTLVLQSDMALPKDINWMRIEVRSDGLPLGTDSPPPLHRNDYAVNPADPPDVRVAIPATFAVFNKKGAVESVAVRVIAGRDNTPRILRDAITTVPADRNAMLRVYLQWLSDGSAAPAPAGGDPRSAQNACPPEQTNIAGTCRDARIDVASLVDYDSVKIYGGPTPESGSGFDALSCFAASEIVTPDAQCSVAIPTDVPESNINVGLQLPAGSDGACSDYRCVVPLDRQDDGLGAVLGWRARNGRIELPPGVCTPARPQMRVVLARECPSKTSANPLCGPASAVPCTIKGTQDGSAPPPDGPVPPPAEVFGLALGTEHTCSLRADGFRCWGRSDAGETATVSVRVAPGGNNPTRPGSPAIPLGPIAAGKDASCVIVSDPYCWGNNRTGAVGVPPIKNMTAPITTPAAIALPGRDGAPLLTVSCSADSTESHTCAASASNVWCWGANSAGQLGRPLGAASLPAAPIALSVTQLALGRDFTCALRADKRVECWGANDAAQCGSPGGPTLPRGTAVPIPGDPPVQAIAAGSRFACALTMDARVFCWGDDGGGAVSGTAGGAAINPPRLLALASLPAGTATKLAAGTDFACALGGTDTITCWGNNTSGQLGTANTAAKTAQIITPSGFPKAYTALYAGGDRACVAADKRFVCWGASTYNQIRSGSEPTLPPTEVDIP